MTISVYIPEELRGAGTAKNQTVPLIPVSINSAIGALAQKTDLSLVTVEEGTALTLTGTVAIPNNTFSLPVKWKGDYLLFRVPVVDGTFSVTLDFPTSGVGILDDECVNMGWPEPMFTVSPIRFEVVRPAPAA